MPKKNLQTSGLPRPLGPCVTDLDVGKRKRPEQMASVTDVTARGRGGQGAGAVAIDRPQPRDVPQQKADDEAQLRQNAHHQRHVERAAVPGRLVAEQHGQGRLKADGHA